MLKRLNITILSYPRLPVSFSPALPTPLCFSPSLTHFYAARAPLLVLLGTTLCHGWPCGGVLVFSFVLLALVRRRR